VHGIPSLKVRFTRVFGWYIEVTRTHAARVPAGWRRKQTVATASATPTRRSTTSPIACSTPRTAPGTRVECSESSSSGRPRPRPRLQALAARLARWDVAAGLAEIAHRFDYCRPLVERGDVLEIEDGRHAVVERRAAAGRFVPNDVRLDLGGERLWLVTGPNMAGKSTLLRQTALLVILAQMGSYVPARAARVGIVDRVLSRVGASDNLAGGESTFMVEMRRRRRSFATRRAARWSSSTRSAGHQHLRRARHRLAVASTWTSDRLPHPLRHPLS
jgi:DNA mismatch repair protein MutS